ncbi:hypothetical protein PUN28_010889 [Cardiocondyla obscurior]|uniref:Uncharacterized protein n=1 Tax=Cardiocondyla obscurior TaxID=286306 RepID=A0AAW2FK95_9HYME
MFFAGRLIGPAASAGYLPEMMHRQGASLQYCLLFKRFAPFLVPALNFYIELCLVTARQSNTNEKDPGIIKWIGRDPKPGAPELNEYWLFGNIQECNRDHLSHIAWQYPGAPETTGILGLRLGHPSRKGARYRERLRVLEKQKRS